MEDTPPEQPARALTIRPLLQHSPRISDVPGVSLVVFNSPVAVHCIA